MRRTGMTLIELLLAITLFFLLLAAAAGLVRAALQAQVSWGGSVGPYQQMERALSRLEHELESAQPFFGVPFVGDAQQLEWAQVAPVPGDDRPSLAWVRIQYSLEPDEQDRVALTRRAFLWQAGEDSPPLHSEPLMRLRDGRFTFGVQDAQGQLTWVDSWDGERDGIPRLVRLEASMAAGAGQPELAFSHIMRHPAGSLPKLETP